MTDRNEDDDRNRFRWENTILVEITRGLTLPKAAVLFGLLGAGGGGLLTDAILSHRTAPNGVESAELSQCRYSEDKLAAQVSKCDAYAQRIQPKIEALRPEERREIFGGDLPLPDEVPYNSYTIRKRETY